MEIIRIAGELGAEVHGLTLLNNDGLRYLADTEAEHLRHAVSKYGVLFIRNLNLSQIEHMEFAAKFGTVSNAHPLLTNTTENPNIFEINYTTGRTYQPFKQYQTDNPKGGKSSGVAWHTDMTFLDQPPMFSILSAQEMPEFGGDTIWSNQASACAALSKPMRQFLMTLSAYHNSMTSESGETMSAIHPVIISHPTISGIPILYVNETFTTRIKELSLKESDKLLEFLFSHANQHQFTARYRWTQGDIAIWDNRLTQHAVVGDFHNQPRRIQRVVTSGERPLPFNV